MNTVIEMDTDGFIITNGIIAIEVDRKQLEDIQAFVPSDVLEDMANVQCTGHVGTNGPECDKCDKYQLECPGKGEFNEL